MEIQDGPVGERIGVLEAELTEHEPGTFAGLHYQHEPEYRVVVRFTEGGEETVQPYIETDQQLANLVNVRDRASATLAELESDQAEANRVVQEASIPAESYTDVSENRVVVRVTDAESLNTATASPGARSAAAQLPDEVEVVEVEKLLQPTANIYGGLRVTYGPSNLPSDAGYCTTGFSVRNADGRSGVLTAGHCPPSPGRNDFRPMYHSGTRLPLVGTGQRHGPYDVQWHTTPGFVPRAWFRTGFEGGGVRTLYYTKHRLTQHEEEVVCNYGVRTGYGCGKIVTTSMNPARIDGTVDSPSPTFVLVRKTYEASGGPFIAVGDSGGPWFINNTAYGIQSVGDYDEGAYMAINYIYNLRLVTLKAPH